jgi:CTD small phosphatase-like protein 2
MASRYELVLYTAADQRYADQVLNFIERKRRYFAHRLYKTQCVHKPGLYTLKQLEILCGNRDIKNVVLIDNSVRNYALAVRNGIPIKEFKGADADLELIYLAKYMRELVHEPDSRNAIKEHFATFLLEHYQAS